MNKLTKTIALVALVATVTLGVIFSGQLKTAVAHCQVPCGIYDDEGRIKQLQEDSVTIAKAIKMINELAGKTDATSVNQMVRWVQTKEQHASHIITVVAEYYLTQKVKVVASTDAAYPAYLGKLARHHGVMAAAMKTKQKPTAASANALDAAIHELSHDYGHHH